MVAYTLAPANCDVFQAKTPGECLSIMDEVDPDLVLLNDQQVDEAPGGGWNDVLDLGKAAIRVLRTTFPGDSAFSPLALIRAIQSRA